MANYFFFLIIKAFKKWQVPKVLPHEHLEFSSLVVWTLSRRLCFSIWVDSGGLGPHWLAALTALGGSQDKEGVTAPG